MSGRWDNKQKLDKSKLVKALLLVGILAFLGFVIGETIGQSIFPQRAFGLVDTIPPKPFMSTIPPNYWYVAPVKTNNTNYTINDIHQVIGIMLSNACIAAIKSNHTTDCPTYKDILYADNSNQRFSGGFGYVHGFFERLSNNFKQNLAYYYNLKGQTVLVDPPKDIADKIPIIEIYSTLPAWADFNDLNSTTAVNTNSTIGYKTLHQYRIVEDCNSLIGIVYSKAILLDTITFAHSGCITTNLNTTINIPNHYSYSDPTATASYKQQQYVKQAPVKNCIMKHCTFTINPYAKQGYAYAK